MYAKPHLFIRTFEEKKISLLRHRSLLDVTSYKICWWQLTKRVRQQSQIKGNIYICIDEVYSLFPKCATAVLTFKIFFLNKKLFSLVIFSYELSGILIFFYLIATHHYHSSVSDPEVEANPLLTPSAKCAFLPVKTPAIRMV